MNASARLVSTWAVLLIMVSLLSVQESSELTREDRDCPAVFSMHVCVNLKLSVEGQSKE